MFYSDFILSKKGQLGRIWLAAHMDKKLTKKIVMGTDIEKSVDGILRPQVKLALRTSGHLLLGVVRIYARKVKYLLSDYNDAYFKVRMAFRPDLITLSDEMGDGAVTLPEGILNFEMHDFDLNFDISPDLASITMPDLDMPEVSYNVNQTLIEIDDYFGFNDILQENTMQDLSVRNVRARSDFFEAIQFETNVIPPSPEISIQDEPGRSELAAVQPASFREQSLAVGETPVPLREQSMDVDEVPAPVCDPAVVAEEMPQVPLATQETDQTRVSQPDSFALLPVITSEVTGRTRKAKRRRRLIVDVVTHIPVEDMKNARRDTSDIVRSMEDALPKSRQEMLLKEMTAQRFLTLPGRAIPSVDLISNYARHLSTRGYNKATESRAIEAGPRERPTGPHSPAEQPRDLLAGEPHGALVVSVDQMLDEPMITDEPSIATNSRKRKLSALDESRHIPGEPESEISAENLQDAGQMPAPLFADESVQPGDVLPAPSLREIASSTMIQQQSTFIDTLLQKDPLAPPSDSLTTDEISQVTSGSPSEAQAANETVEQLEERITNKRAAKLCSDIKEKMREQEFDRVVFEHLIKNDNCRMVSQKFYSLLVLKKKAVVEVRQTVSFGDIFLTPGKNFDNFPSYSRV